jgi:vacuolar iron transporter family protein
MPGAGPSERHYMHRIGWLRAAVLGADDGIVSTAALVVGVAAAESSRSAVLLAGVAGLVAGAMSMAAGEYVSVSSQADTEQADLARERRELTESPEAELRELQQIYIGRGLDADLALRVAEQLSARDNLGAHARDELGITAAQSARPIQAALASATTFSIGALLPLLVAWFAPERYVIAAVAAISLAALAVLGATAAHAGGAGQVRGATRVLVWSALALAITAGAGRLFGARG